MYCLPLPRHALLLAWATSAVLCCSVPANAQVSTIQNSTDLDLSGTIDYSVNFGGNSGATFEVDGVTFDPFGGGDTVAGVSTDPAGLRTFTGAEGFWNITPNLGGDVDINSVLSPIIDANDGADLTGFGIDLDTTIGQTYKLQLIMMERFFQTAGSRIFDISVDGVAVVNDLDLYQVAVVDAGLPEGDGAVLVTHQFVSDGTVDIDFSNDASLSLIAGLTLESVAAIPEPSAAFALSLLGLTGICSRRRTAIR